VPEVQTRVLERAPSLASVLLRGALTGRGRGGDLPELALRLEGVAPERDRLLRYQRLCGFAGGDVLPHTYPHVLGFPLQVALMADRRFPLPLPGLVHVRNEITVHRPLTAQDRLDITVRADALREHPKGRAVDLLTELAVAGERAWEERSTYLHRCGPRPGAPHEDTPPTVPHGDPAAVWQLPADLGRRYAAVSGDVNPIHLHPLTARPLGFRRPIAHGMWTSARVLAALGRPTSGPSTSRVWFTRPILLPGPVALHVHRGTGGCGTTTAALRRPGRDEEHLVLDWSR
jgi:acyl dehydratase